jgi:hypothetical protein
MMPTREYMTTTLQSAVTLVRNLAIAFVVGWIVIQIAFPAWTIRYRLTLVAEVDGREVTGSGVIETHWRSQGVLARLTGVPWDVSVRGEAVVLDLGERGIFFLLLRQDPRGGRGLDAAHLVSRYFAGRSVGSVTSVMLQAMTPSRPPVSLDLNDLPLTVRFRDLADPRSVEKVDPTNLVASFGQGVRLQRATIRIVPTGWPIFDRLGWPRSLAGEPVTEGIGNQLKWLGRYPEPSLVKASDPSNPTLSAEIHHGDFRMGTE